MFSNYHYHCPGCNASLNKDGRVHFVLKTNGESTNISLNPNPGEYDYNCEPELHLTEGEVYDFFCPECDKNLQSDRFNEFVEINMKVTDEIEFEVLFSRVCGQHCTYVVTEDMVERHGEHPKDLI